MGRPRKSPALKALSGAQPCRLGLDAPSPRGPLADPPGPLDGDGETAWARVVDQLAAMGLGTSADADLVYFYAITHSRWVKASRDLDDEGLTTSGQFGLKPNPLANIVDKLQAQLIKILAQLGMTPAGRASLKATPKEEEDPLLAFVAARSAAKSPHGNSKSTGKARAGKGRKAKA